VVCCLASLDGSVQFGSSPVIIKCYEELSYLPAWKKIGKGYTCDAALYIDTSALYIYIYIWDNSTQIILQAL